MVFKKELRKELDAKISQSWKKTRRQDKLTKKLKLQKVKVYPVPLQESEVVNRISYEALHISTNFLKYRIILQGQFMYPLLV